MALTVEFLDTPSSSSSLLVVPVGADKKFTLPAGMLKPDTVKFIQHALSASGKFKGKPGETLSVPLPDGETYTSLLFAGFQGDSKDTRPISVSASEAGSKLYPVLKDSWAKVATFVVTPELLAGVKDRTAGVAHIAKGLLLNSYSFEAYKSAPKTKKAEAPVKLEKVQFVSAGKAGVKSADLKKGFAPLKAVAEGVFLSRDLANTPPNDLYPESYAKLIEKELKPLGVEVEILDDKALTKMGAGAIMAVGQGSARQPRMVVMRWKGKGAKGKKPLGFVGKGVTFDTGGISLKPAPGWKT